MPAYDLMVLIDPDIPEERRTAIVDDIKKRIDSADGALKGDAAWGMRKLAYEINHRPDAYYHLFQLEASPELLKTLEHSLAIDDAVLRHRIIRLPKGVPDKTPTPSQPGRESDHARRREGPPADSGAGAPEAGEDPGPEPSADEPGAGEPS
jgi:small subunit ribosomal protein S6